MTKGFLSRITYSNWLWILGLLLLLLSVAYQTLTGVSVPSSNSFDFPLEVIPGLGGVVVSIRTFFASIWLKNAFSLVAILTGALLLQYFSSNNRLIRVRSFFPFFLYCILGASLFSFVNQPLVYVTSMLLVGAFYRIFSVAEKREMNRAMFDASFIVALASLTFNRLIWLLPFFWLAALYIQSLSIRNILSSLVGFLSVYWLVGGLSYLYNDYSYLLNCLQNILEIRLIEFSSLSSFAIMYLVFMGLLLLIAFGSFIQQQNQDKLSTRKNMYAVLVIWLGLMGLWLTSSSFNTAFLFLACIPTLVYYAHFYSLRDGVVIRLLFFLHLTVSLLAFFLFQ